MRPVVWYQKSFPENDVYQLKVEVCERLYSATGERLPDTDFMIGWTTLRSPNCTEKTWVMALLEKPEHHATIRALSMQMEDNSSSMYLVTIKWVATPVAGSTEGEQPKVEGAIKVNGVDINNWTYINITGIPPYDRCIHNLASNSPHVW